MKTASDVASFYKEYDEYITADKLDLDLSINLDILGRFCNLFLVNVCSLLKSYNTDNFYAPMQKCIENLVSLQKIEKNPQLNQIVKKTIGLVGKLSIEASVIDEIYDIVYPLYCLFDVRLKRAQAALLFNITAVNKTKKNADAVKKIAEYISTKLPECKPPERDGYTKKNDPLMMNTNDYANISKFIKKKQKKAPICDNCNRRATVFAYPCHCPVGCKKCWNGSEDRICPLCGNLIEEFIEVE